MWRRIFPRGEETARDDRRDFRREVSWQDKALEGVDKHDGQTIREIRQTVSNLGQGRNWYYGGAFKDFSPLLLAPKKSSHTWVDPAYSPGCFWYHDDCAESVAKVFKPVGVESQIAQTSIPNGQEVTIDTDTKVNLVPGNIYDETTLPKDIDVIYYTGFTPPPIQALRALKTNGVFIVDSPRQRNFFNYLEGLTLQDLGFEEIKLRNHKVKKWAFPRLDISSYEPSIYGQQVEFAVYQKTRELTAEENDLLKFESVLRMVDGAINDYMIIYRNNGANEKYFEDGLDLAFRSCAAALQKATPETQEAAKAVKTNLQYMASELPKTMVDRIADEFRHLGPARIQYIKQIFEKFPGLKI